MSEAEEPKLRAQPLMRCQQLEASTKRVKFYVVEQNTAISRVDMKGIKRRPKESLCRTFLRFLFPPKGRKVSLWEDDVKSTMEVLVGLDRLFVFRSDMDDGYHIVYYASDDDDGQHTLFGVPFAPDQKRLSNDDSADGQEILRWIRSGSVELANVPRSIYVDKKIVQAEEKREIAHDLSRLLGADVANMIVDLHDASEKFRVPSLARQQQKAFKPAKSELATRLLQAASAKIYKGEAFTMQVRSRDGKTQDMRFRLSRLLPNVLFVLSLEFGWSFKVSLLDVVGTTYGKTFTIHDVNELAEFPWQRFDALAIVEDFAKDIEAYFIQMRLSDWRWVPVGQFDSCPSSVSVLFAEFLRHGTFLRPIRGFKLATVNNNQEVTFSQKKLAKTQAEFEKARKTWDEKEADLVQATLKKLAISLEKDDKAAEEHEAWLLAKYPKSKQYIKPRKPAEKKKEKLPSTILGVVQHFAELGDCPTIARFLESIEEEFWDHFQLASMYAGPSWVRL